VTAVLTIVCFMCSLSEGILYSSGSTIGTDEAGEQHNFYKV
jgi:hypothetical protein